MPDYAEKEFIFASGFYLWEAFPKGSLDWTEKQHLAWIDQRVCNDLRGSAPEYVLELIQVLAYAITDEYVTEGNTNKGEEQ